MHHHSNMHTINVHPSDLIALAWSAPLRDLAARVGLSDVGLKKQLLSYGVPLPPQGYWNKVEAGKRVPIVPHSAPRKPGQLSTVAIDRRFRDIIQTAAPMSSMGPFASELVPEDLDELLKIEMEAIGAVKVPKTLGHAPPGLRDILLKEEKRRVKAARTGWSYAGPVFDSPVGQRQLRLWSTLYSTIVKRGHAGHAYEQEGQLTGLIRIGDSPIAVQIEILGGGRHHSGRRHLDTLPPGTPLIITINPGFHGRFKKSWQDGSGSLLEEKVGTIAASTIVAGEAVLRAGLREAEERAALEVARRDDEERRRRQARNEQRIQALRTSGDLLRQAKEIRELVALVNDAVKNGSQQVDASILAAWESWALNEADRLDPILSGQFRDHVLPPEEDE